MFVHRSLKSSTVKEWVEIPISWSIVESTYKRHTQNNITETHLLKKSFKKSRVVEN